MCFVYDTDEYIEDFLSKEERARQIMKQSMMVRIDHQTKNTITAFMENDQRSSVIQKILHCHRQIKRKSLLNQYGKYHDTFNVD